MIKINALNEESEEESGSEVEVTREALEQIAQQQYYKALELKHTGRSGEAACLLAALLDTELLHDVRKPPPGEKSSSHLLDLKYLCHKNLGTMLSEAGDLDGAITAYIAAAELDDTDITLWYRLGLVCMQAKRFEVALQAFRCGSHRNPQHMPCLDKIITLLLALDKDKEELIATIYESLKLDPGYLRALAYRKYVYTKYLHVRDYMESLNPIYKWDEKHDEPINEDKALSLLGEAEEIHKAYLQQQAQNELKCVIPTLKLKKVISQYSWESVAESLVHMHGYMTENCYSHACPIEVLFVKQDTHNLMEVCEEINEMLETALNETEESVIDLDKSVPNTIENNDRVDKDKTVDTEKGDSDPEPQLESTLDLDRKKKIPVRRRGSALSFLEQWEWCKRSNGNKRRSNRKKEKRQDDNIYDTLRRMVPQHLTPETGQIDKESANNANAVGPDAPEKSEDLKIEDPLEYFGTESEQQDVKQFIKKYTDHNHDIIQILKEFLFILSEKYKIKWPTRLPKLYVEANECYSTHISIPSEFHDPDEDILQYSLVNLLAQEFIVNEKLTRNKADTHDFSVLQVIGNTINFKPSAFVKANILEIMLRYLWLKLHVNILNKTGEDGLDYLYQLLNEFEAMGDKHDEYKLVVVNFTFKPTIKEAAVVEYITFMERNDKLSTVMDLHNRNCHEEVLSIIEESFEHCKVMAGQQEDEMSLDFATQLMLILETLWVLGRADECFKWALTCLHEALKHYFRHTSGSPKYEKWTRTVVKILSSMEHILKTEGLACLEVVTQKELSQGLEDLIRIIGHQVETNAAEMPLDTVAPWIIMHYIIQREDDQGRCRGPVSPENNEEDVPNPLMILFIAHEQLGGRSWCCKSDAKLLYFILDTVTPRLRSPLLAKALEQISPHMEQVVYCLYGHPARKSKLRYLMDHNVTPHTLDWKRAQQIYEIYRPPVLPALEGKVSGITQDTQLLFKRTLELLPPEYDPKPYVPELEKYLKGTEEKLPQVKTLLPYKIKDIYFLLGNYHFKKEEHKLAIEYNMLDVLVNNDRLESWAAMSLSKSCRLETLLNSCQNLKKWEFLTPAKSAIRCFKRTLQLDPTYSTVLMEYGIFVYYVHSFCSRLLKQASESLSMEDFDSLEKQKEDMLDTTQKCFMTVMNHMDTSSETDKSNEDAWLKFYMLGKVAEKRNKPPSVYLDYYMQAVKSLQDANASYPLKINYNTPTHLCREVLELHYRIHASILKFIEQHENKPISKSVGAVFQKCINDWNDSPFSKRPRKEDAADADAESKLPEPAAPAAVHAANILKRSISDVGEEGNPEAKQQKLDNAAAKVKRSFSYDTERSNNTERPNKPSQVSSENLHIKSIKEDAVGETERINSSVDFEMKDNSVPEPKKKDHCQHTNKLQTKKRDDNSKNDKAESSSTSSSSSSSDSSASESSSDSSASSRDSAELPAHQPLPDPEIMAIVSACIDALEDCASRFPPQYKAIYRLAHYHFYYKKGKDIERCRDLMLSTFTLRVGQKLGGLFSERKHSNFFNNIWKINITEVDRAGSFAFHMSRSVLLTMEILKEIDDHKTLLDLSLHLQRTPEPEKKYLRDSDREELAQQAFSLCVHSLKGQLLKFSQQADLKSNDVERQALKSLMLDIYRAYQKAQKHTNSKQFTNLLVDAYKLVATTPYTENTNLVDVSIKYCQWLVSNLKQQATQASLDKSQHAQKKQSAKIAAEMAKSAATLSAPTPAVAAAAPKADPKSAPPLVPPGPAMPPVSTAHTPGIPGLQDFSKMSATEINNLQNYINVMRAALTSSYQAEFCRQFFAQDSLFYNYPPPPPKKKRGPKPKSDLTLHKSKSVPNSTVASSSKSSAVASLAARQKTSSGPGSLAPSMGTVLASLPPAMAASLTFPAPPPAPAPPPPPSAGKTLQEKLAERQKNLPSMSKSSKDLTASMMKLPSSLTITKTATSRKSVIQGKKPEPPPVPPQTSDVIIVLDDDD